jgi:hypothetical protein
MSSAHKLMGHTYLVHLCRQSVGVEVGFGETLYRVLASVGGRGTAAKLALEVHAAEHGRVAVLGGRGALEDLEDLVDDRVAASAKTADDLELLGGVLRIRGERGDEADVLAVEHAALCDDVPRGQHILENGGK